MSLLFSGTVCGEKSGINYESIKSCTNSMYGRHWQYQAGLETKFINVQRVPHVVINGVFDSTR